MGFNNCKSKAQEQDEDDSPISNYWYDQEALDEVAGRKREVEKPAGCCCCNVGGYVISINYAHEVALRQRGLA